MDWGSLFATIYLLGVLFTAAALAKPIRRIMGADQPGMHAHADDHDDARIIVVAVISGIALMWPLTLTMYVFSRMIRTDDTDDHGIDLVLVDSAPAE